MAYRRKIIDRRTREGKALGQRLDAFKGFVILALVGSYLLFGRGHQDDPGKAATEALVSPAQAMPSASPTPARQQFGGPGYSGYTAPAIPAVAATNMSANSVPPPVAGTAPERQQVPWRHVTASGVRWSLRTVSPTSMLLVVDLGGDKVANVSVAPAFERLDMAGMNDRVDHVRSIIAQGYPLQTGNFTFDRDGTLRQIP